MVILIPAFEPEPILLEVVVTLEDLGVTHLIVVDDGSGPKFRTLFDQLEQRPHVEVLRHAVNLGKGAALKTGLNHALWRHPTCPGVITADADGQHRPGDIRRVAESLLNQSDRLVLGVRQFERISPWRSRLGNALTCLLFRVLYGQKLTDTQTGLRGIPRRLIPELLRLPTTGYEFELDMLVLARWQRLTLEQVPIQTVYLEGNRGSHFRPLRDSFRVYCILLRFLAIALLTAVVDNGLFALVFAWSEVAPLAQITARLLASLLQFRLHQKLFSRIANRPRIPGRDYFVLTALFAATSYFLLLTFHHLLGCSIITAKCLAEAALFLVNYRWLRDHFVSEPLELVTLPSAAMAFSKSAGPQTGESDLG